MRALWSEVAQAEAGCGAVALAGRVPRWHRWAQSVRAVLAAASRGSVSMPPTHQHRPAAPPSVRLAPLPHPTCEYISRMRWYCASPLPNTKSTMRSTPSCRTSSRRRVRMCLRSLRVKLEGVSDLSRTIWEGVQGRGTGVWGRSCMEAWMQAA